ncbi:hypothetical protein SLS58_008609 [Diplodia intermedia]|uniref:Ankyrin repeat protein n=1 Tax=Diplodia intermedia TaxID=856260 RepID=A0ABR3TH12_9PEZI
MMCAQELFSIFFNTVAAQIENEELGGDIEIVEGPPNTTLSEMIENVTSSGIGDQNDAVACLVPVLHSAGKLSYLTMVKTARTAANEHIQRKDWDKAEDILLPMLKLTVQNLQPNTVTALRASHVSISLVSVCELYRKALVGDSQSFLFGLRGFLTLHRLWTDSKLKNIPEDPSIYNNLPMTRVAYEHMEEVRYAQELLDYRGIVTRFEHETVDCSTILEEDDPSAMLYAFRYDSTLEQQRPMLAIAAKNGFYSAIKCLQSLGFSSSEVDYNGRNFLHYAAEKFDVAVFEDLVGEDHRLLQEVDYNWRTTLHLAAAAGRRDVVNVLLSKFSLDINATDKFFMSPLDHTIFADHPTTFALFSDLRKGKRAKPSFRDHLKTQASNLIKAACCGSANVVKDILDIIIGPEPTTSTSDFEIRLQECRSAFTSCVCTNSENYIAVVDAFIENGFNVDMRLSAGDRAALSFASEAASADLVRFLIDKQADPSKKDESGRTSLHYAVKSQSELTVKALLKSTSHDIMEADISGTSPLDLALADKSFTIASMVLKKDTRGQDLILPYSAIAATQETSSTEVSLYFQGTDSQIRKVAVNGQGGLPDPDLPSVPASARIYTPLAVVGCHTKV